MEMIWFWIVCGVIGSIIGSSKGAKFSGFMWGLFLGPIGILIVCFSKGNRRKCPACRELIDNEAQRCKHCGATLFC